MIHVGLKREREMPVSKIGGFCDDLSLQMINVRDVDISDMRRFKLTWKYATPITKTVSTKNDRRHLSEDKNPNKIVFQS